MVRAYLVYQVELPDMMRNITVRGVRKEGEIGVITLTEAQLSQVIEQLEIFDKSEMFGCNLIIREENGHTEYAFLPWNVENIYFNDGVTYFSTPGKSLKPIKFTSI